MRAAAASLAAAIAVLAGCAGGGEAGRDDARKGGSITVALAAEPDSLDPAVASSPEALRALWLVHTPPITYARAGGAGGTELVPGLADALPEASDDGRSFAFTFRRGLRYSDGRRLKAADFERGVKRSLRLSRGARELFRNVVGAPDYARGLLSGADIEGIATDPGTRQVTVELVTPDPGFPFALASTFAAPAPAGTKVLAPRPPPGIGPYRFGRPDAGEEFVLARRRGFSLPGVPRGNVDEIAGEVIESPEGQARAAIDGFVDAIQTEPPVALLPDIRSKYKDRYAEHPTLALRHLAMGDDRAPFADRDVRRAVALALDGATLDRLRDGLIEPSCALIPAGVTGHESPEPCPYGGLAGTPDLVEARGLVQDARLAIPPVLVTAGSDPRAVALERHLAATMRKIGLDARPARGARERARAAIRFARRAPTIPHPARYLEVAEDPLLGSRVRLLELEGSPADLASEWAELDRAIVDDAQVVPYGTETVGVLLSERMDAANCSRFHLVHGLDWSSLCLR